MALSRFAFKQEDYAARVAIMQTKFDGTNQTSLKAKELMSKAHASFQTAREVRAKGGTDLEIAAAIHNHGDDTTYFTHEPVAVAMENYRLLNNATVKNSAISEAAVNKVRNERPRSNPAITGIDPAHKGILSVRIGCIYGVKTRVQFAQHLLQAGFAFRRGGQAVEYLSGWSRDGKWAKCNCDLMVTPRLLALLDDEAGNLVINGVPVTVHVISADGYENCTRFRILGPEEEDISLFVRKLITLGLHAK